MSSLVRQLLYFVVLAIHNVCAHLQCTQHSKSLPISVYSAMLGYSNGSQTAYLIGGKSDNRIDDVYKWDTKSPSNWFTSETPAPTAMDSSGAQIFATINDVVYIVSPKTQDSHPYTSGSAIYRFDTTSEQWLTPINFTTPLGKWLIAPCVTHNQTHIILVGGFDHYCDNCQIYILFYEIVRDAWTTHTLEAPFEATGNVDRGWWATYCSYAQENLYIFGGVYYPPSSSHLVHRYLDDIYKYDITSRAFVSLAKLPTPQAFGIAVYDGGNYIYLVGGKQNHSGPYLDAIRIFNVSTEQLLDETITAVFPFYQGVSMIFDEQLWIFGGADESVRYDKVQKCNLLSTKTLMDSSSSSSSSPSSFFSSGTIRAVFGAAAFAAFCICSARVYYIIIKRKRGRPQPYEILNVDDDDAYDLEFLNAIVELQLAQPDDHDQKAIHEADEPAFAQLLRQWGLGHFVKRFEEDGFTNVSVWTTVGVADAELKAMGLRPGHIKTFQCKCAELQRNNLLRGEAEAEHEQPGAAPYPPAGDVVGALTGADIDDGNLINRESVDADDEQLPLTAEGNHDDQKEVQNNDVPELVVKKQQPTIYIP